MSQDLFPPTPAQLLRVCQIIWGALLLGPLTFAAIAVFLVLQMPAGAGGPPVTTLALAAGLLAGPMLGLHFALPPLLAAQARRKLATQADAPAALDTGLRPQYQAILIVRAALLEGITFLCLVFFVVSRHAGFLAAALVPLAIHLAEFPSADRMTRWLRQQQELWELERPSNSPQGP